MRKAGILAALLLLAPSISQAKTLEELLVEKGVITKGEAAKTSMSTSPAKVYYNEGTRIEFPDAGFALKINTLIQTRYTWTNTEEWAPRRPGNSPATFNGVNGTRVDTSSFDVHRARLIVSGSALHNEFLYRLEADFVGTANEEQGFRQGIEGRYDQVDGRKEPNLKDAYLVWQPCEGFGTQMGQFRTFNSRQFNTDPGKLQFADRSIVSGYHTLGRSQGLAQHASFMDGKLSASAAIFNGVSDGEGFNRTGVDTDHTGMVAVRVNPTGKMDAFEEGDVNYSEDFATSIGGSWGYSEAHNNVGIGRQEDTVITHASLDANAKFRGVSVHLEAFREDGETEHSDNLDYDTLGGYGQVGFFLMPRTLEVAGRYGYLDCDNGRAPGICSGLDGVNEIGGTINYYWWKHAMKAQLGYYFYNEDLQTRAANGESDINTEKWMFQVSSYF